MDKHIHFKSPSHDELDSKQLTTLEELKCLLEQDEIYIMSPEAQLFCSNSQLIRFLIARNWIIKPTYDLLIGAIKWRNTRNVDKIELGWEEKMSKESETGKIYIPGYDKFQRPVIIFDNTVQNTQSTDDQMNFLAWNLELAIKFMPSKIDKYVILMNLSNFSFFNIPPMKVTTETIYMISQGYPERLGHCICYAPPGIFSTFFNTIKGFIDPKTRNKIIFLTGDMSEGSKNDIKMKEIIGDNWKILTGADSKYEKDGCSPGYIHSLYWPFTMKRILDMNKGHLNFDCYRDKVKMQNNNNNNNNNNNSNLLSSDNIQNNNNNNNKDNKDNNMKAVCVDDFLSDDSDSEDAAFDKNTYENHDGIYDNRIIGLDDFSDEDDVDSEEFSNCNVNEKVNLHKIDNNDKNDKNLKIFHNEILYSNLSHIDSLINLFPPSSPLLISFIIINIVISIIGYGSLTFGFLMLILVVVTHLLDINRIS